MRLSGHYRTTIKEILTRHFGEESKFYLFGSRVDDTKRGGDIDLYIETDLDSDKAWDARSKSWIEMQRRLEEQKIDIVVHINGTEFSGIEKIAKRDGVEL